MFFKHNDSLERRVWLGIGEALLAAYVFGTLYLLPSISFWKYRSDGDSLIHDLAQFFPELIVSGFFALAVSFHVVIPLGALLGFLLPKIAVQCKPVQAFLIGGMVGVIMAFATAVLIGPVLGAQPATTLRFWTDPDYVGQPLAIYCALWTGLRLAYLCKQIRAEKPLAGC
jgi:hypothetical protein